MTAWDERRCWTTQFDVETTATVTGLKTDTIYHYVSRKDPRFPQPTMELGRVYFRADHVFEYILRHRRKRHSYVPRLFPRVSEPTAAEFLGALSIKLPDFGLFAVHLWQPGDGASPVAVVYPERDNHMVCSDTSAVAQALLGQLPAHVQAAAIPNGEAVPYPQGDDPRAAQPIIVVAERTSTYLRNQVGTSATSYYWWSDLANLLRTDIPWWSSLLREPHAMLTWRPGSPVQQITPAPSDYDPGHITALAARNPSARPALQRLADRVLRLANGSERHDRFALSPGLVHAAISTVDVTKPVPVLTTDEVVQVLGCRASAHDAGHALRVTDLFAFMPVLTNVIRVNRATAEGISRQWTSRLVDVARDRRNELGYWYVGRDLHPEVTPARWLADPDNDHSWIIQGDNGVLYAGVGTAMPAARGRLVSAEIGDEASFYTDDTGTVWPLPGTGFSYHRAGHRGAGPERLAETLTALIGNAAADVHQPPLRNGRNTELVEALYRSVSTHQAPLVIRADELPCIRAASPIAE